MREAGANTLLEMGPGKVLAGLTKRIDNSLQARAIQTAEDLEQAIAALD
jgi:[acyl-carrier-protein] S-malonyltransferase